MLNIGVAKNALSHYIAIFRCSESASEAQKEAYPHSLGSWYLRTGVEPARLQLDDSSLQADHGRLRSIVGAQFGEDVLDSPLDGFLGDLELIRDLLIGISGCDQAEHIDFCRRQRIIRRMLGDFVRGFGRKSLLSGMNRSDCV
jgi:hypothetical protein